MDDDRLVLEGLERVPPASPDQPAFFYIHLMSPHYLGVQFAESHVFTRPDDAVSPGLEPYKILEQLNKPDRYDDKVRQADGIIRQLFDALRAEALSGRCDRGRHRRPRRGTRRASLGARMASLQRRHPDSDAALRRAGGELSRICRSPRRWTSRRRFSTGSGCRFRRRGKDESLLAPIRKRFTYHQTYFVPNRFAVLYRDERRAVQVHRHAAVRHRGAVRPHQRSWRGAQSCGRAAGTGCAPPRQGARLSH